MARMRKFWGWGWEDAGPDEAQSAGITRTLEKRFGAGPLELRPEPRLEDLSLPICTPHTLTTARIGWR